MKYNRSHLTGRVHCQRDGDVAAFSERLGAALHVQFEWLNDEAESNQDYMRAWALGNVLKIMFSHGDGSRDFRMSIGSWGNPLGTIKDRPKLIDISPFIATAIRDVARVEGVEETPKTTLTCDVEFVWNDTFDSLQKSLSLNLMLDFSRRGMEKELLADSLGLVFSLVVLDDHRCRIWVKNADNAYAQAIDVSPFVASILDKYGAEVI